MTGLSPVWQLKAAQSDSDNLHSVLPPHQRTVKEYFLQRENWQATTCEPFFTCQQLERLLSGEDIEGTTPNNDTLLQSAYPDGVCPSTTMFWLPLTVMLLTGRDFNI